MKIFKLILVATALSLSGCGSEANSPKGFVSLEDGYVLSVTYGSKEKTYYNSPYMSDVKYKAASQSITVNFKYNDKQCNSYFYGPQISYAIYMY